MKNLEELKKELTELIVSSDVVINRREFRTMYFVSDLKKQRKTKLLNLFNSNSQINKEKEFTECEYFMSISKYSDNYVVCFNEELFEKFIEQMMNIHKEKLTYEVFVNYFKDLLQDKFSFDCIRCLFVTCCKYPRISLQSFEHDYKYKNPAEDRTIMIPFKKHKFDILNKYSYIQIVRLFKINY